MKSTLEPHEAPLPILAELVKRIVAVEGPIHLEELSRRVSGAFGKARTGSRIAEATDLALKAARKLDPGLLLMGSFVTTAAQRDQTPIRDRSAESGSLIKATCLSPQAVKAAASRIHAEPGKMDREDLIRAISRLLGYLRVGSDLFAVISAEIE